MRFICGILMVLTITALSLISIYFAVYAFDLPRLGAAYALVFLVMFTIAGGLVYWIERYR